MLKQLLKLRELVIFLCVVITALVFYAVQPGDTNRFLTADNFRAILTGIATDGLMAIGMTFVIITGGFDLSVGSSLALGGYAASVALLAGYGTVAAICLGILSGALVGLINGFIITRIKVNPLVTTLGTMTIVRGIVLVETQGATVTGFPASFRQLGEGRVAGIFYPIIIFIVLLVIADLLLRHSRYLRQIYYIGGNEEAARLSGISVDGVRMVMYLITGMLAAFAGVISTAKNGSASPIAGTGAELRVIAAVVIGGASLSGGSGTILGTFLGLLLTGMIANGLGFLRVSFYSEGIITGLILIIAVMIDQLTGERARSFWKLLTTTRNKKMERAINVVLGLIIVALLVFLPRWGAPTPGASAQAVKEADANEEYIFIGKSISNPYWVDAREGLEDRAAMLGVKADFRGSAGADVNEQVRQLEDALARRPKGIIIAPAGPGVTPIINRAIDSGIPVICVDSDAPDSKRYSYVGTDNYNAGRQGGELLGKILNGKGEVFMLSVPGEPNLEARVKGYRDALTKFPEIRIINVGNDRADPAEAAKVARAALSANPNLAAFGCVDAGGGEGAAVVLKEKGLVGKVKIVGMDRNEATLNLIEEGVIDASIAQRTYTMAYMGLGMLYDLHHNKVKMVSDWRSAGVLPLPTNVDTGTVVITKENVKAFRKK
ncbi:MAG TPA: substrate-binding domain-containing protein [Blastocatellia bacterium]|nr:substrate-binding domain-containing protein [Blastocatellia bacterium]